MSNVLLVPVHLDALVLDQDEVVVEATADFSRLPFYTGKRDINPDIANISEEIVATPFQNRNLRLNKGIHLHWSLPDALTKARPDPNKPDIQDFPRVPNRWLVTRTERGTNKKEWIVESDYLYPVAEGNISGTGVTVPYHKAPNQAQPFRYMGRVLELSQQGREQGEYYPKLTAVGYGEPTFAAFYPNCHSVFGFCDEDYSGTTDGRRYYVMGWYSNPEHDVIKTHILAALRAGGPDFPQLLKDIFKWKFDLPNIDLPNRMMCYARVDLLQRKSPRQHGRATVAIGNTGTEALSACLAPTLRSNAPKEIVEDQLEALHLAPSLEYRQLDVPAKFVEGRHEKGFAAVPGGTLWTIQIESPVDKPAQADGSTPAALPPELGRLLNTVNKCQADYDRAWQKIESLRIQLFSDWYKYMLCAYPPEDTRDAYPDIDQVASYVDYRRALLDEEITNVGEVALDETSAGVAARVKSGTDSSPAGALTRAINAVQTFLNSLPKPGPAYKLKQTSGPRYWRPTEPSVLIDGSIAEPSKRHGQDGLVPIDFLPGVDNVDLAETRLRERFRQRIDGIAASAKNFGFTTWEAQPWNPFLLEWEIEVFPVEYHSNIDPATGRYQHDFVTANYQLVENDVDLSLKPGRGAWTLAANLYSGRSILTPHATAQLTLKSESHIEKEVLPLYLKEKNLVMSERESNFFATHMEEILRWYETSATSALLRAANPADDTTLTAFRAWSASQKPQRLSQSLSGLNEALLMHKQTLQLLVADPLGFNDYQPFANRVGNTVHRSIYSAPDPLNDFNPIRSGMMKIHRLRLVDTFGQSKDLDVTKIILSESLDDGTPDTLVNLPPRLTQPARVNFRWLSADGNQEMNDLPATTPICGWVLANHLDNSLMIYDSDGKALGSLLKKDKAVTWEPSPGGRPTDSIGNANPHLKKVVKTIQDWGPDFLDDFISAIDSAVENIEPENFVHHEDLALLMGRPLALVRALVNLELKGLPASHQGWNEFRQDMASQDTERDTRDDNGFTSVKFPIRIGEYRQFNDGTVGYWKEKPDGTYEDNAFFSPQSDANVKFKGDHLKTHKTDPDAMVFYQTVQADPQILSLLIDPRGSVHATSGIVPVKAINIPPDHYGAALQAIEVTFLSTPIVTDAGKIHLPLPEEPGYQWSWLQDMRGKWSEVSSRGVVRKETFAPEFGSQANDIWKELLELVWIELDKDDPTRAGVTEKDKRLSATLHSFKDLTERIEDVLDRAHIGPVNLTAKFTGPQEIREGWLKLSVAQTSRKNSKP